MHLAKTELGVRPCVAFLHTGEDTHNEANVEETLMPRLDPKEVAAVFSAPFHNFLLDRDETPSSETQGPREGRWYKGSWTDWHESRWRMHNFYVPIAGQTVTKPKRDTDESAAADHLEKLKTYRVFGMTARILVDCARIAYNQEPTFEHNSHLGDEEMIVRLQRAGRLGEIRKPGDELKQEDLAKAAKI